MHADCIYCRTQTTGKEGLPHIIPEALGPNDLVLPGGAECDKCNHYFGRKLEPNLYRYPGVALALQLWAFTERRGSGSDSALSSVLTKARHRLAATPSRVRLIGQPERGAFMRSP